jgi:hypothetical protein
MTPAHVWRDMAKREADAALLAVLTEELKRRGISQANFWALVILNDGTQAAADRFTLILADALADAKVTIHNRTVMDAVWTNLRPLQAA